MAEGFIPSEIRAETVVSRARRPIHPEDFRALGAVAPGGKMEAPDDILLLQLPRILAGANGRLSRMLAAAQGEDHLRAEDGFIRMQVVQGIKMHRLMIEPEEIIVLMHALREHAVGNCPGDRTRRVELPDLLLHVAEDALPGVAGDKVLLIEDRPHAHRRMIPVAPDHAPHFVQTDVRGTEAAVLVHHQLPVAVAPVHDRLRVRAVRGPVAVAAHFFERPDLVLGHGVGECLAHPEIRHMIRKPVDRGLLSVDKEPVLRVIAKFTETKRRVVSIDDVPFAHDLCMEAVEMRFLRTPGADKRNRKRLMEHTLAAPGHILKIRNRFRGGLPRLIHDPGQDLHRAGTRVHGDQLGLHVRFPGIPLQMACLYKRAPQRDAHAVSLRQTDTPRDPAALIVPGLKVVTVAVHGEHIRALPEERGVRDVHLKPDARGEMHFEEHGIEVDLALGAHALKIEGDSLLPVFLAQKKCPPVPRAPAVHGEGIVLPAVGLGLRDSVERDKIVRDGHGFPGFVVKVPPGRPPCARSARHPVALVRDLPGNPDPLRLSEGKLPARIDPQCFSHGRSPVPCGSRCFFSILFS